MSVITVYQQFPVPHSDTSPFSSTHKCIHKWNIHLACTVQPRGHTGIRQVITFACGGVVEYCTNQNATPANF